MNNPGKTVTKKAAGGKIPSPKGTNRPGMTVVEKAATGTPKKLLLNKSVAAKGLAKQDPHQSGPRGHMSYKA